MRCVRCSTTTASRSRTQRSPPCGALTPWAEVAWLASNSRVAFCRRKAPSGLTAARGPAEGAGPCARARVSIDAASEQAVCDCRCVAPAQSDEPSVLHADSMELFPDRREAGLLLAHAVAGLKLAHPIVLALPRGGVPVAAEVARR